MTLRDKKIFIRKETEILSFYSTNHFNKEDSFRGVKLYCVIRRLFFLIMFFSELFPKGSSVSVQSVGQSLSITEETRLLLLIRLVSWVPILFLLTSSVVQDT